MKKVVKTRDYKFMAVIKPAEEGGFYAYCPLLPGCVTQGETYTETISNVEEAIKAYVEVMIEVGDPVPEEALVEKSYAVVPKHPSQVLKKGTLKKILEGAQLTVEEFKKL